MVCIYKITSPSGKIYIGQTWDYKRRMKCYKYEATIKNKSRIYSSIKKYGWENHIFEPIEECKENITQEKLNNLEYKHWKYYKNLGYEMLNIRGTGSRGKLAQSTIDKIKKKRETFRHTEESKEKMRKPRPAMLNKVNKHIICLNNNQEYESLTLAAKELNLSQGNISNVLTNRIKSTKGFKFKYAKI